MILCRNFALHGNRTVLMHAVTAYYLFSDTYYFPEKASINGTEHSVNGAQ